MKMFLPLITQNLSGLYNEKRLYQLHELLLLLHGPFKGIQFTLFSIQVLLYARNIEIKSFMLCSICVISHTEKHTIILKGIQNQYLRICSLQLVLFWYME